jgi:acyl carrier protein
LEQIRLSAEKNLSVAARPYTSKSSVYMPDNRSRLIQWFQAMFPDLSDREVMRASVDRVAAWDSIATVTLAAAVEEEFGTAFEPSEIEKANLFSTAFSTVWNRL